MAVMSIIWKGRVGGDGIYDSASPGALKNLHYSYGVKIILPQTLSSCSSYCNLLTNANTGRTNIILNECIFKVFSA